MPIALFLDIRESVDAHWVTRLSPVFLWCTFATRLDRRVGGSFVSLWNRALQQVVPRYRTYCSCIARAAYGRSNL